MSLRPRRIVCALAVLLLALGPSRANDAEAVKRRLDEAKRVFDGEAEQFKKAITELLDKREDEARKAGNKKLLDQIKAEQKAFEKRGELPAVYPTALQTQMKAARGNLEKAYTAAMKDYLLLKEDAAAEAVEKEQQKFVFDSALLFGKRTYLVALKHYDVRVWNDTFTNNGTQGDRREVKLRANGELVPHSIFLHPPTKGSSQVRYPLAGKWTAFRTVIGVPKIEEGAEDPSSPLTFEVFGDGKSLWKSEPVTKRDTFQTCVLRVEKVRVLTLQVHCPDGHGFARAVWFEPVLME